MIVPMAFQIDSKAVNCYINVIHFVCVVSKFSGAQAREIFRSKIIERNSSSFQAQNKIEYANWMYIFHLEQVDVFSYTIMVLFKGFSLHPIS